MTGRGHFFRLEMFFDSLVTRHMSKILRLFIVLIDSPVGNISPQMPYM